MCLFCQRERTIVSHADRDLSVDRPDPDDKGLGKPDKEHKKRAEKERERREDRDRRYRDWDDKDLDHDGNGDFDGTLRHKRKPPRRLDDTAAEHGGEGAESPGIHPISASSYGDKNALKSEYAAWRIYIYIHVYIHRYCVFELDNLKILEVS